MGSLDRTIRFLGLALVALVGFVGYQALRPHSTFAVDGVDARWDAAVRESRSSNQPGVVLYTADWCPACQALHAGALADSRVWTELQRHHTFVAIDLTRGTDPHAKAAGVGGIPTLIRYDRDGHETGRTHGLPADQLVAWLQQDN